MSRQKRFHASIEQMPPASGYILVEAERTLQLHGAAECAARKSLVNASKWVEHLQVSIGSLEVYLASGRVPNVPNENWRTRVRHTLRS